MKYMGMQPSAKFFVTNDYGCFGWADRNGALHDCSYKGVFKATWRGIWKVKGEVK